MNSRVLLLLVVVLLGCWAAQVFSQAPVAITACKFARATWYPIARKNGVPQGTCGFGQVMDDMPSYARAGRLTTPDDETYNQAAKYISQGGLGWACGECISVTGPKGIVVLMVADVCDFSKSPNCGGSQNRDYQNFNIENVTWPLVSENSGGEIPINFQRVSCDTQGKNISFYFADGAPNTFWFSLRFYNYRVGIRNVQISQGSTWVTLTRVWTNQYIWEDRGEVKFPFKIRIASVLGQTIELSTVINSAADLVQNKRYKSLNQFPVPPVKFPSCKGSGPAARIYKDAFGSVAKIAWRDWGSWGVTTNFAATNGCFSGKCIQISGLKTGSGFQFGFPHSFGKALFQNVTMRVRVTSGSLSGVKVLWDAPGGVSSSQVTLPTITTAWKQINLRLSQFTIAADRLQVLKFLGAGNIAFTLLLDDINLIPQPAGTGPMTGYPQCAGIAQANCNKNFWCAWTGSACVNNPF